MMSVDASALRDGTSAIAQNAPAVDVVAQKVTTRRVLRAPVRALRQSKGEHF